MDGSDRLGEMIAMHDLLMAIDERRNQVLFQYDSTYRQVHSRDRKYSDSDLTQRKYELECEIGREYLRLFKGESIEPTESGKD